MVRIPRFFFGAIGKVLKQLNREAASASITIFYTPVGGTAVPLGAATDPYAAFVTTKALNIGQDDMSYFLDKLVAHVTDKGDQTDLVLEIYGSDSEDGAFQFLDSIDLSLEDPGYTDAPGKRYYKFRFIDEAVRERWQLHGFDIYGEVGGEEF